MRSDLKQALEAAHINPATTVLNCEWDDDAGMFALYLPNGDFVAHVDESEKRIFLRMLNR